MKMGLETRFNTWLIGTLMGKKYLWEKKNLIERTHVEQDKVLLDIKKEVTSLKGFLQGGVEEFKSNVKVKKSIFSFKKKAEKKPEEEGEW